MQLETKLKKELKTICVYIILKSNQTVVMFK